MKSSMKRTMIPGPIADRAPAWPPSGRSSGSEYSLAEAEAEVEGEVAVVKVEVGDVSLVSVVSVVRVVSVVSVVSVVMVVRLEVRLGKLDMTTEVLDVLELNLMKGLVDEALARVSW